MIKIIVFGKIKAPELLGLKKEYVKRLGRFTKLKIIEWKETTFEKDNKKVIEYYQDKKSEKIILLDEASTLYSTKQFDKQISKWEEFGNLTFLIGRAEGFTNEVKELIKDKISISPMTFTHEMAQVLLLEQIYRVMTLRAGIPYHKS
jgi:23S rRNA (pseudouridine1915-N3)-methyltransferase